MSNTSPSDLATTFRSIPRRLREAQSDTPPEVIRQHTAAVDGHLASAARLLRTTADPATIADAIENAPADSWDNATLDGLRAIALDLGGSLRSMAAANPQPDND